jgi:Asp-tRNA(Asn)/Glu-tRNA(Gln) amidotransferase A subunit family amidase
VVGAGSSQATNLSGHPQVVVPTVVREGATAADPTNQGVSFVAALYREDLVLRLAHAWQSASDIHLRRPPKFS